MSNQEPTLTATVIRYLLAINELDSSASGVKSIDIAKLLRVTKPSVHTMIKKLCEKGYATHAKYEAVHLTAFGNRTGYFYGVKVLVAVITVLHIAFSKIIAYFLLLLLA